MVVNKRSSKTKGEVTRQGRVARNTAGTAVRKASGSAGAPGSARDSKAPVTRVDYTGWRALLNPLWCYHGFRMAVAVLTVFGLVMVFSSSAATMAAKGQAPYKELISQGLFCVIGLVVGVVAAFLPVKLYRHAGILAVGFAMFLQALTFTPLGHNAGGNTGWIYIGSVSIQPAEIMKFALCIWLPAALMSASRRYERGEVLWRAYGVAVGVYGLCVLLVIGGKDLGTAMILVFIGIVAFLVGGFPLKWMGLFTAVMAVGVILLVATSKNRRDRILAAYTACSDTQTQGVCFQSIHARYAMASGGFLGVGLGNSREKWNYLPEAHNDFIFAIIGEETGFVGAATIILMFCVLIWCLTWMALQIKDRYVSMALMCVTVWLGGQALVNIGVVVGIFPVLGVPMPFVSSGGSSLVMCLAAAGMVVGLMRAQPQIKAARSKL